MIAWKFLAPGAVSPFTGFRWPERGEWVGAPSGREDAWIHACRTRDLPYWLAEELWQIELDAPVREAAYQVASPRARLVGRVEAWGPVLRSAYARACALRARDLALPHLAPGLRDALADEDDLGRVAAALRSRGGPSRVAEYLGDAAANALSVGPATASYIAAILAATVGGGADAFEAERAWQARWLADRLGEPPAAAPAR